MEKEKAKEILADVITESIGWESNKPQGEGITSEDYIRQQVTKVFNEYFLREEEPVEEYTRKDVWSAEKVDDLLFRLATRAKQTQESINGEGMTREDVTDILKMIWILIETYRPEIAKAINQ